MAGLLLNREQSLKPRNRVATIIFFKGLTIIIIIITTFIIIIMIFD